MLFQVTWQNEGASHLRPLTRQDQVMRSRYQDSDDGVQCLGLRSIGRKVQGWEVGCRSRGRNPTLGPRVGVGADVLR